MWRMLHQGTDHPAQSEQTLVDVSSLAGTFVNRPGSPDTFTACQIHLKKDK